MRARYFKRFENSDYFTVKKGLLDFFKVNRGLIWWNLGITMWSSPIEKIKVKISENPKAEISLRKWKSKGN